MKKTFALMLAIFVLVTAVCVFVPTGTASAATDNFHWMSAGDSLTFSFYPSDASAKWVSVSINKMNPVVTPGGVTFFSLRSLVDKWHAVYPDSSFVRYILRVDFPDVSLLSGNVLCWSTYSEHDAVTETTKVEFSYSYNSNSSSNWSDTQSVSPASVYSSDVSSSRVVHTMRFRFSPLENVYDLLALDELWVAFGLGTAHYNVAGTALTEIQKYFDDNTVNTSSESYNVGYDKGKTDAFATLANTLLTDHEYIGNVVVSAYDSSGNVLAGTNWDLDYNFMYNEEKYLQVYNISNSSANVDHYLISLYFDNKQSFVPVTVRSSTGFVSSGNNTAPLVPVSYLGGGLYGSDFGNLGSATSFDVYINSGQTSVTLRVLGNSYGNNLDAVYETGLKAGLQRGEKIGYDKGKADGIRDSGQYSFFNLVASVIDVPINAILSLFNLEIFGVNLAPLMTALLTICVAVTIIKMIL